MTADQIAPLLLSAVEAARACGVSRSSWYGLLSSGRVPLPVRLGRSVRWSAEELRRWTEAGCPSRERWLTMKGELNGAI